MGKKMEKYAFYYPGSIFDCKRKWCERWIDQHVTSVGQRENLSSGQESKPWPPEHRASARSFNWARMWLGSISAAGDRAEDVTGVLNTARINTVEAIVGSDGKICHNRKMSKKNMPPKLPRADALLPPRKNNAPSPGKRFFQRFCHLWKSSTYNTERTFKIILLLIPTFSIRCTGHNFQ